MPAVCFYLVWLYTRLRAKLAVCIASAFNFCPVETGLFIRYAMTYRLQYTKNHISHFIHDFASLSHYSTFAFYTMSISHFRTFAFYNQPGVVQKPLFGMAACLRSSKTTEVHQVFCGSSAVSFNGTNAITQHNAACHTPPSRRILNNNILTTNHFRRFHTTSGHRKTRCKPPHFRFNFQ